MNIALLKILKKIKNRHSSHAERKLLTWAEVMNQKNLTMYGKIETVAKLFSDECKDFEPNTTKARQEFMTENAKDRRFAILFYATM